MLNGPKAHDLLFWFDAKPKLLSDWGPGPPKSLGLVYMALGLVPLAHLNSLKSTIFITTTRRDFFVKLPDVGYKDTLNKSPPWRVSNIGK